VQAGAANAADLLRRLGRAEIPIAIGAGKPLVQDMRPLRKLFGAGEIADPPGGPDAARALAGLALANPGEITVVAIGPMTNLAQALTLEPGFAGAVAELVLMAGSATTYAQNVTTVTDFNAHADPEALQMVL